VKLWAYLFLEFTGLISIKKIFKVIG